MSDNINELSSLFSADTPENVTFHHALDGSAELNTLANSIANKALTTMLSDIEAYGVNMKISQTDNRALDQLVDAFVTDEDLQKAKDIYKDKSHAICLQTLKSQQSCRSRSRHKDMTKDNYKKLFTAATCEKLLRYAGNMPAGHVNRSSSREASLQPYTEEELAELTKDQANVRRLLRNVQSKKTLCKQKENYEESTRWQSLCQIEHQLISIRITLPRVYHASQTPRMPTLKTYKATKMTELEKLMDGVDLSKIDTNNCKDLLTKIKGVVEKPIDTGLNKLPAATNDKSTTLLDVPVSKAEENPATAETTRRPVGESVTPKSKGGRKKKAVKNVTTETKVAAKVEA